MSIEVVHVLRFTFHVCPFCPFRRFRVCLVYMYFEPHYTTGRRRKPIMTPKVPTAPSPQPRNFPLLVAPDGLHIECCCATPPSLPAPTPPRGSAGEGGGVRAVKSTTPKRGTALALEKSFPVSSHFAYHAPYQWDISKCLPQSIGGRFAPTPFSPFSPSPPLGGGEGA